MAHDLDATGDRPATQIKVSSALIEAGATALILSGYGSEFEYVTAKQAVLEVLMAMDLVSRQDGSEKDYELPR